jgi:hypothetical protein
MYCLGRRHVRSRIREYLGTCTELRWISIGFADRPFDAKIVEGTIAVTNINKGVARTVTTNRTGSYSLPNLLPGAYVVDVSASGFGTKHLTGITIAVGTAQVLDVSLDIAAKEEQVIVPANIEDLQLATSDISGFVGGETIRDLPLNGRSWFDLAVLQPGVAAIQAQRSFAIGTDRGTRGFGSQLTVSGARTQQNNYLLNGTSLDDYANDFGSVIGGNLGVNVISKFTVITTNASAEYGRSAGMDPQCRNSLRYECISRQWIRVRSQQYIRRA